MSSSFPGISTYEQPKVYYPYGTLASHILGYVGPISSNELKENSDYDMNDSIGKTGIEKVFEKYLKGKDGIKQIDMSVDGVVTDEYTSKEAIAGSDLVLTIDADLQKVTENALENNIKQMQSQGMSTTNSGAAVVINVKTGEVLAMASYPNYDPSLFIDGISTENWNKYLNDESKPLLNKAISDKSAPGSTFKMVTAIAGL
jgi:penicillin-binding protein 2